MKLYYYKDSRGNFGDDLNPWLWDRLLPGVFDDDDRILFVGIGTLLQEPMPAAPLKVVFGSGAWYGRPLPTVDEGYRVYFVRGPLSAQVLGLGPEKAITDPAILVREVGRGEAPKRHRASYMPHHWSGELGDWEELCATVGLHYINPARPVAEVLEEIRESEVLFTEAMHGAIVADAVRTPWVAVKAYRHILDFKWQDWCQSLGLRYEPLPLTSLWRQLPRTGVVGRLRHAIKKRLVAWSLRRLRRLGRPQLSCDADLARAHTRVREMLDCFKADVRAGVFAGSLRGLPV